MIAEDVDTDISELEEIFDVPHCKTQHDRPGVKKWAGECTHEVAAVMEYCEGRGGVCLNTVIGYSRLSPHRQCVACGRTIGECWKIYPRG